MLRGGGGRGTRKEGIATAGAEMARSHAGGSSSRGRFREERSAGRSNNNNNDNNNNNNKNNKNKINGSNNGNNRCIQ